MSTAKQGEVSNAFFYLIRKGIFYGIYFGDRNRFYTDYIGPFESFGEAKKAAISQMKVQIANLDYSIKLLEHLGAGTARQMSDGSDTF